MLTSLFPAINVNCVRRNVSIFLFSFSRQPINPKMTNEYAKQQQQQGCHISGRLHLKFIVTLSLLPPTTSLNNKLDKKTLDVPSRRFCMSLHNITFILLFYWRIVLRIIRIKWYRRTSIFAWYRSHLPSYVSLFKLQLKWNEKYMKHKSFYIQFS